MPAVTEGRAVPQWLQIYLGIIIKLIIVKFQVVSCRVNLQAVGLLPMWMMILSRAPLMILVFDP
jgi:hypothetical protein